MVFKLIIENSGLNRRLAIALRWIPQNPTSEKSTGNGLCSPTTSHCLIQCWPRSMSPCDVTRSQWVKHPSWSRFLTFTQTILMLIHDVFSSHPKAYIIIYLWIDFLFGMPSRSRNFSSFVTEIIIHINNCSSIGTQGGTQSYNHVQYISSLSFANTKDPLKISFKYVLTHNCNIFVMIIPYMKKRP